MSMNFGKPNMSLGEFLDMAYRKLNGNDLPQYQAAGPVHQYATGRPRCGPPLSVGPQHDVEEFVKFALADIAYFEESSQKAFAILVHPIDYAKIEMLGFERGDVQLFERGENEALMLRETICQQALDIPEGTYMIVGKSDYEELIRQQRDSIV